MYFRGFFLKLKILRLFSLLLYPWLSCNKLKLIWLFANLWFLKFCYHWLRVGKVFNRKSYRILFIYFIWLKLTEQSIILDFDCWLFLQNLNFLRTFIQYLGLGKLEMLFFLFFILYYNLLFANIDFHLNLFVYNQSRRWTFRKIKLFFLISLYYLLNLYRLLLLCL